MVKTDLVPLLANVSSTVDPRTYLTPTTTPPQSTSSPLQAIDLKSTTRPKIYGTMAKLLRRRCCIRSLQHSMEVAIRPKAFVIDDEDDDDEDTALLTESSSRTASSSFEIDDADGDNILKWNKYDVILSHVGLSKWNRHDVDRRGFYIWKKNILANINNFRLKRKKNVAIPIFKSLDYRS